MDRALSAALFAALFALAVGDPCPAGDESCSSAYEPESAQGAALLQTRPKSGSADSPAMEGAEEDEDPGHKVLLLARQHDNGTYVISQKPRHTSQLQGVASARGAGGLSAEAQEVLDIHNLYRCMHGVPLMTWDSAIAANAQTWADNGHYGHSSTAFRTLPGIGGTGENLAWGYPTRSGKDSVQAWYDEIIFTDGTPGSCTDKNSDAGNEAICHYTQVVWKSSTKLGCGKGKANVVNGQNSYNGDFWVCHYGPPGNYGGQFTSNVLAPAKTAAECAGPAPAPAPQLSEDTQDPNCKDGAATDSPVIKYSDGSNAACSDLHWGCSQYAFVTAKCKKTCNAC